MKEKQRGEKCGGIYLAEEDYRRIHLLVIFSVSTGAVIFDGEGIMDIEGWTSTR